MSGLPERLRDLFIPRQEPVSEDYVDLLSGGLRWLAPVSRRSDLIGMIGIEPQNGDAIFVESDNTAWVYLADDRAWIQYSGIANIEGKDYITKEEGWARMID